MENPLDSMTWEERFKFALHALIVMEGKYEDALRELEHSRQLVRKRSPHNEPLESIVLRIENNNRRLNRAAEARRLRATGMSFEQIAQTMNLGHRMAALRLSTY